MSRHTLRYWDSGLAHRLAFRRKKFQKLNLLFFSIDRVRNYLFRLFYKKGINLALVVR